MKARMLLLGFVLLGCSEGEPKRAGRAPSFAPDEGVAAAGSGPAVLLRSSPGAGDDLTVDVVARGIEGTVHGAAFRLTWDPDRLAFVDARAGHVWSEGSVRLAKEGAPGELVVVWTEKGTGGGARSTGETVLGTLAFRRKSPGDVAIAFRADRSTLRDATGTTLATEWRGGRVSN